jgi:DNA-binding GntR family transcriptional regulator
MPSERELMVVLGVGRSTVGKALHGLALGVVEIRHGEGAFVARDPAVLGATDGIAAALEKGVTRMLLDIELGGPEIIASSGALLGCLGAA